MQNSGSSIFETHHSSLISRESKAGSMAFSVIALSADLVRVVVD